MMAFVAFASFAQSVPGCSTYTSHAVINLNGASNQTISGDSINAAGGAYGIQLTNCHDIHITKCKIWNATLGFGGAIAIQSGCYNIYVDTCYIYNSNRGVLVNNISSTSNIRINYNYFKDIQEPGRATGGGCSVQFVQVTGTGLTCDSNQSYHTTPNSGIGDQFSIYKSNGTSTSYIKVYYNTCLNGSTDASGLVGTVLGDVGGSYQDAEYNIYINAGSVGCQVQGGSHIIMSNNIIFGYKNTSASTGIAYGNYSGTLSTDITMANNKISFTRANGTVLNKWYDTSTYVDPTATPKVPISAPTGWSTNTSDTVVDPTVTPLGMYILSLDKGHCDK